MSAARDRHHEREARYQWLLEGACTRDPNCALLAEIMASWEQGLSALPARLGLASADYRALLKHYFGLEPEAISGPIGKDELDPRLDDIQEFLLKLMRDQAAHEGPEPRWIAQLIATACQGRQHLWEDLGVWNRASLGQLLAHNFPDLAARNTRDMKWKKFLFKQLCETEGIYICRAPTCDQCSEFSDCFGPEE